MTFGNSAGFGLLWFLPIAVAVRIIGARLRFRAYQEVCDSHLSRFVLPPYSAIERAYQRSMIFAGAALVCFVVAALRPQIGYHLVDRPARGADVVIALDVSASMNVKDVLPSRLARAKREITDLVTGLEGGRVALVTFAGASFVELPLTRDFATFRLFLEGVTPELMPLPGTNIASALKRSLATLEKGAGQTNSTSAAPARPRIVVLVTDGEDFSSETRESVAELLKAHAKLFVLGIGTPKGGMIPEGNAYKRDAGRLVVSRLDPELLSDLAQAGGGISATVPSDRNAGTRILEAIIRTVPNRPGTSLGKKRVPNEYFQWPLGAGLAFFFLYLWSERRGIRREQAEALRLSGLIGRSLAMLLVSLHVSPMYAQAETTQPKQLEKLGARVRKLYDDGYFREAIVESPETTVDPRFPAVRGASHYRLREFDAAAKAFMQAAELEKDERRKASFLYNGGNSFAQDGAYQQAIDAYTQSLALNPEDRQAQENLEYVKRLLEEEKKNPSEKENKPKEDDDEQKSDENKESSGQDSSESKQNNSDQNKDQSEKNSSPETTTSTSSTETTTTTQPRPQESESSVTSTTTSSSSTTSTEQRSPEQKGEPQPEQRPKPTDAESEEKKRSAQDKGQKEETSDRAQTMPKKESTLDLTPEEERNARRTPALEGIEEDRGALLQFRRRKALEERTDDESENGKDY